jgi:hypothetical protein
MEGMEKQTAVNWLVDKLEIFATEEEMNIIEQAKQMEKEQIIEAHYEGSENYRRQYYNETFKSE